MVLKKLLYSVVGCMLFTSCYDEDALTPGDRVLESRFEFPQGSNSWDEEAQDILDEFGIYLIYKNYAEDDFNRSWTGGTGGGGFQSNYTGSDLNDTQAEEAIAFMQKHIFTYLNRDVIQKALPPYIYLAYDLSARTEFIPGYPAKSNVNISFEGLDYWAISWGGIQEISTGLGTPPITSPIAPPTTAKECWKMRGEFMQVTFRKAIENGGIEMPTGFGDNFDYKTAIQYADAYKDDPNYYMMRGFPGKMGFSGFNLSPIYKVTEMNPEKCFIAYVQMCMYYTREEFESQFASTYTLLAEMRQQVVDYMKEKYNIDLEAIAKGPDIAQ